MLRSTVIVAALVLAAPLAQAQSAATLAGEWKGGYVSTDGSDINTFEVKMRQTGGTLSGTITEINKFGDPSRALFLTSTLTGRVQGAEVTFTKTYDGSGGVSHAVQYRGRLEPNGRRVRGSYDAEGTTGTFELVR
jgi:hypothetical protein